MGIVLKIRDKKASSDAPVLYRDALVNKGTLMLHDFSNGGSFLNEEIKSGTELYDLGRDVSFPLGINNSAKLKTAEGKENDVVFTEGKGIEISSFTEDAGLSSPQGFDLGKDVMNYLTQNKPVLFIIWVRSSGESRGRFLTSGGEASTTLIFSKTATISSRVAGISSGGISYQEGDLYQFCVEFRGVGQRLKKYVNGTYHSESSEEAIGFDATEETLLIGSRSIANPDVVFYRDAIFDLEKSPFTAEELVRKDWEYCTGTGEFLGKPTKRPFIDKL